MKNFALKEKDKAVLNLIVENYLKAGRPISSGLITQRRRLAESPATIRNIMAKLETLGLLGKPHTSAGRVPTDKGLRFYVNSLLEEKLLPESVPRFPAAESYLGKGDLNSLLSQVSKILADQSDNLGFVLPPRVSQIHFRYLRFIKIGESKVMAILVSTFNLVLTEILETHIYFTQAELDSASQYMNQSFRGKNIVFVRDYLVQELPKFKLKYDSLFNKLILLLKDHILQEERENQIFLRGTSKLIDKADMFNMEKLKALFQNFEEKARLARLLSDFIALDRVKVLIGTESEFPDISDCSLILSHYGYQNQVLGSLGIIGPKRIPYKRIIPLVDSVAKGLSQAISHH
jgi:heat-inducible transcriptional repressor